MKQNRGYLIQRKLDFSSPKTSKNKILNCQKDDDYVLSLIDRAKYNLAIQKRNKKYLIEISKENPGILNKKKFKNEIYENFAQKVMKQLEKNKNEELKEIKKIRKHFLKENINRFKDLHFSNTFKTDKILYDNLQKEIGEISKKIKEKDIAKENKYSNRQHLQTDFSLPKINNNNYKVDIINKNFKPSYKNRNNLTLVDLSKDVEIIQNEDKSKNYGIVHHSTNTCKYKVNTKHNPFCYENINDF